MGTSNFGLITRLIVAIAAMLSVALGAGCETSGDRVERDRQLPHSETSSDNLVEIETNLPEQVFAGSEFEYEMTLTNISDFMLYDVVMRHYESSKRPETDGPRRMGEGPDREARVAYDDYEVGRLRPGQTKTVRVRSVVEDAGTFEACTAVLYTPAVCFAASVINPELSLVKRGPETAMVGEEISYDLIVSNQGVGSARDVVVLDELPRGLRGENGRQRHTFEAGTLAPGESETFTVTATATRTGEFTNPATARSARGLRAEAQQTTVVRQPSLAIEKTGPETDYSNIGIDFEITVTNTGDAVARNVVVEDEIPSSARFLEASGGGTFENGVVSWRLGNLDPGESRMLVTTIEGGEPGRLRNCVVARSDFVEPVTDCATVRLEGVTGLLIELADENDPIRIGEQERYTVTVLNQGNKAATNVRLAMILDERVEFVSMTGPTSLVRTDEGVRARPLDRLAPGDSATWEVTVQGRGAGDSRFRVRMTAEELNRPVFVGESTRIFE